jgi:hypothetical protein
MDSGNYGGILSNILYSDQINLNGDFLKFLEKENAPGSLISYVKELFDTDGSISFYDKVIEKVEKDISLFLASEDSVFDYSLAQPFNDNLSIAAVVKDFFDKESSKKDLTYFQRLSTYLTCWFNSMNTPADYTNSASLWAGNAFSSFWESNLVLTDDNGVVFPTRASLVEYAVELGGKIDDEQCNYLRNIHFDSDKSEALKDELLTAEADAISNEKDADSELASAQQSYDDAKESYNKAIENVQESQEEADKAKAEYDACVASGEPNCEKEQEAYEKAFTALQEAIDELNSEEKNLAQKTQELAFAESIADGAKRASKVAIQNVAAFNESIDCGQCYDVKYVYARCTDEGDCSNAPSSLKLADILEDSVDTGLLISSPEGAEPEWTCCYTFQEKVYDAEPSDTVGSVDIFEVENEEPCTAPQCNQA